MDDSAKHLSHSAKELDQLQATASAYTVVQSVVHAQNTFKKIEIIRKTIHAARSPNEHISDISPAALATASLIEQVCLEPLLKTEACALRDDEAVSFLTQLQHVSTFFCFVLNSHQGPS